MDYSLWRYSVHGILQARTLEWAAISFSNAGKWKVKVKSLSCVWLLATPWTAAHQAPPSMGFSRQEYWSGLPFPSPGDLPHPGMEPGSPALQADSLPTKPLGKSLIWVLGIISSFTDHNNLLRWQLVFLPGEFHGQRSLAGYSPWGCKESYLIEWLSISQWEQRGPNW